MRCLFVLFALTTFSTATLAADLPPDHPPIGAKKPAQAVPAAQLTQKGKVLNVIEVPSYTYMEVAQDNKKSGSPPPR